MTAPADLREVVDYVNPFCKYLIEHSLPRLPGSIAYLYPFHQVLSPAVRFERN